MTAQITDTVWHNGTIYSLMKEEGEGFFDPKDHGLLPASLSASSERGWWADYGILDGQLRLEVLQIHTDGNYPAVNGKMPQSTAEGSSLYEAHRTYRGLALPLQFTGRLALAKDPERSWYIPGSGMCPWGYRTVKILTFENGILQDEEDQSSIAASVRTALTQACNANGESITGAYALDYASSLSLCWWMK